MYEEAIVDVERFDLGFGTDTGVLDVVELAPEPQAAGRADSSSEPLSQASSSPQSEME